MGTQDVDAVLTIRRFTINNRLMATVHLSDPRPGRANIYSCSTTDVEAEKLAQWIVREKSNSKIIVRRI